MKIKITLLLVTLITVILSFSYKQIVNENRLIEIATKPAVNSKTMTGKHESGTRINNEGNVSFNNKSFVLNSTMDEIETKVKAASKNKTENKPNSVEDKVELEGFLAGFVDSGKPEVIMEHFAALRRARAELIENKMSVEADDPEWTQDLINSFQLVEQVAPFVEGMNLTDTDCRETICALHFNLQEGTTFKQVEPVMSNIGIVLGTDAWVHHDAQPEGPVVYVARVNTVLPDLDLK